MLFRSSSNIFFNESYSNAKEDIFLATNLARVMILELGMGQTLYSSESEVAQVLKDTLAEVENFLAGMRENIELIAHHHCAGQLGTPRIRHGYLCERELRV